MQADIKLIKSFTKDKNAGNPAGVVVNANDLTYEQILNITQQLGFGESAFLQESDVAVCKIRLFSVVQEVNSCITATLAAAHIIAQSSHKNKIVFETKIGNREISIEPDGLLLIQQPSVKYIHTDIDRIIVMIGQWLKYESEAREYVFGLTKSMIATYLGYGQAIIVPYLLTDASYCEAFEEIAAQYGAEFFEIQLLVDKDEAVKRLHERGIWGEEGTLPITEKDLPIINELYDTMVQETAKRPNIINIHPVKGDIDATYKAFL